MNPLRPTLQPSGEAGPDEQQARYFQLMKQGWNNNDACRAVGVCRKTGTRWRLGRTETKNGHTRSYPALDTVITTRISARFLSEEERVRIADLHRSGRSMRFIADELGRAASTISRELQRNTDTASDRYLPHTANRLAARRRTRPKLTRIAADPELRISNDVDRLSTVMARAGEAPEVVLEATYGWYWAVDALRELRRAGASGASVGRQGI